MNLGGILTLGSSQTTSHEPGLMNLGGVLTFTHGLIFAPDELPVASQVPIGRATRIFGCVAEAASGTGAASASRAAGRTANQGERPGQVLAEAGQSRGQPSAAFGGRVVNPHDRSRDYAYDSLYGSSDV